MHQISRHAAAFVDPRGRCNRRGLLVAAGLMLVVEALLAVVVWSSGVALAGPVALLAKLALLWVAIAACARRLHDLGRSAWVLAWAVPATIAWAVAVALAVVAVAGLDALSPSSPWHTAAVVLCTVPALLGTFWLHVAPGQPGPNRFGAEPDGIGLASRASHDEACALGAGDDRAAQAA